MLYIRGNSLGFAMVVASALVAGFGGFILKLSDPIVMIGVGLSLILMDLIIRFRSRRVERWLMQKEYGGFLYILPVWIFGIVVIAINLINMLQAA